MARAPSGHDICASTSPAAEFARVIASRSPSPDAANEPGSPSVDRPAVISWRQIAISEIPRKLRVSVKSFFGDPLQRPGLSWPVSLTVDCLVAGTTVRSAVRARPLSAWREPGWFCLFLLSGLLRTVRPILPGSDGGQGDSAVIQLVREHLPQPRPGERLEEGLFRIVVDQP